MINARWPGKCALCGVEIVKGESVWFLKGSGVRCTACGQHPCNSSKPSETPVPQPAPAATGNLTEEQLYSLRERLAAGTRITRLAKEVGMSWQKLHAILTGGKQPSTPACRPKPSDPDTGTNGAVKCSDGVYRYEFSSVTDAVQDALADFAQTTHNQEFIRNRMDEALGGKDPWASRYTREKFLKELSDPKQSLLAAVDEMRAELVAEFPLPTSPRRRVRHGQEFGEDIDVDRWLRRIPECWDRNVREQQPRRTVTIGCNLAANASVKAHQTLYRGAAALALADILTSRGVNVSIVLFDAVRYPTDLVASGIIRYVVKDHQMPLDIGAVAFAMCEIAWFRVVGALGGMRHWPGKASEGLGSAMRQLPAADRQSCDYAIDADVLSKEAAQQWLRNTMAAQESEVVHV